MTKVSIIIPHFNDIVRLNICLEALSSQLLPETEVIVVDNMSSVSIDFLEERFPDVSFHCEERRGAAAARNRGISIARGRVVAFIDADCIPGPNWIAKVHNFDPSQGVVGGDVLVFDEAVENGERTGVQAFENIFAFKNNKYITKHKFSVTANLVTSREIISKVGDFTVGVSEDKDWCHRAVNLGFSLAFQPDLIVFHPSRREWSELSKKWRRLCRESMQLREDDFYSRAKWFLLALCMPFTAVPHSMDIIFDTRILTKREKLKAIWILFMIRSYRGLIMIRELRLELVSRV
jgi:GT2 family glycosyltransferase